MQRPPMRCMQVPRALQSAEAFLEALGWGHAEVTSAPEDKDPLLRFHKLCRDYLDYKDAADEALVSAVQVLRARTQVL